MSFKHLLASAAMLIGVSTSLSAADANLKWYGFIRNYFAYDSRECKAGTADMFTYLPLDTKMENGVDQNATPHFSYTAITSRLGVDVSGYEIEGIKVGAKIEGDFYAGLTGVSGTAQFRLRQAYLTLAKAKTTIKIGQAWHPMAADMPDIFALNTGAPFGPFNRSPLVQADFKLSDIYTLTAAAIWQMQYTSAGPDGAKADYIKYGFVPQLYLGISHSYNGFTARLGAEMTSIKPRTRTATGTLAKDRLTNFLGFAYVAYKGNDFTIKAKTTFGQGGEHLSLNTGYAVSAYNPYKDGSLSYTALCHSSSWLSLLYGKKVQGGLFLGYAKNFGSSKEIAPGTIYFYKNSAPSMNQMYRITPSVIYNLGKVALGLECEYTSVQYGKQCNKYGLYKDGLHWVSNARIQAMVKYTF